MSTPLIYQEDVAETFWVKRAERIYVPYSDTFSYFCHLSKNVWNQAQYKVLEEYKKSGRILSYEEMDKILNDRSYYENPDFDNYHRLSASSSQQTISIHHNAWKSFEVAKKDYFENPDKNYTGMPKEPGYKKKDGEFILIFTNRQCKIRNGYLIFPKELMAYNFENKKWIIFPKIKVRCDDSYTKDGFDLYGGYDNCAKDGDYDNYTKDGDEKKNIKLQEVRIVPQGVGYIVEIVYDKELIRKKYDLNPKIIVGIDLGVENLAAITDNIGNRPIIIKSDILKSENQWYNKKLSELLSIYSRQPTMCILNDKLGNKIVIQRTYGKKKNIGNELAVITDNRKWIVMDILHKLSKWIIEYALEMKAKIIAIGRNPGWKQKIKMGKKNNQNFVNIPFAKLADLVRYKAEEVGIDVLDPEESYTSKCSFLDSEGLEHHDVYIGERVHRGLFRSSKGILVNRGRKKDVLINEINTDVQGAYNIIRKVDPKFSVNDIMEGVVAHGLVPERLNVSDLLN